MYHLIPVQGGYLTTVTGETVVHPNPGAAIQAAEQQIAGWYGALRHLQRQPNPETLFTTLITTTLITTLTSESSLS
jgi:hypothetical protein